MGTERSESGEWSDRRELVLARDDRECRFCGMTENEHLDEHDRSLDVHHVIPREDGGTDRTKNLVTLCRSCHQTLESLHGQAMSEVISAEDYSEDLQQFTKTWNEYWETYDQYNQALWAFADSNPVFRDEFAIYNDPFEKDVPAVQSRTLEEYADEADGEITSEWEFAVKFGYQEALIDLLGTLDGRTGIPFDDIDDRSDD